MFSFFKKKPIEVKYGRSNYIANEANYKRDNERSWILLSSAVFIEAKDISMGLQRAEHDRLEIYPKGVLDEKEEKLLKFDLTVTDILKVKERMEQVEDLEVRKFETYVYYAVNSNSLRDARAKAEEKYEDKEELFEYIWKRREIYEKTLFRLGFIAQSIWQIRLAVYFNILHKDVAWSHLSKLADFARPLMTLFDSWEEYSLNIQQFHEVYEFEYPEERDFIAKAMVCLNKREESPYVMIPYDLGIDRAYPYNLKYHTNKLPPLINSEDNPERLMLLELMEREDKRQLWEILDGYSKEKRNLELPIFIESCALSCSEEDLIELPELYPDSYYAYMIRGAYFDKFAWDARGSGVSSTVGKENYNLFFERLDWALNDFLKAHELNPDDSTVWGNIYSISIHFKTEDKQALKEKMYQNIRTKALDHLFCVNLVETFKRTRWWGYKGENLDWAREVLANTSRGDLSRVIIFSVILEHYSYAIMCDVEEKEARKIFKNRQIKTELNQYLDEVLENADKIPYTLADKLVWWYVNVGDYHRLRQVMSGLKIGQYSLDVLNDEYKEEYIQILMHWFRSV